MWKSWNHAEMQSKSHFGNCSVLPPYWWKSSFPGQEMARPEAGSGQHLGHTGYKKLTVEGKSHSPIGSHVLLMVPPAPFLPSAAALTLTPNSPPPLFPCHLSPSLMPHSLTHSLLPAAAFLNVTKAPSAFVPPSLPPLVSHCLFIAALVSQLPASPASISKLPSSSHYHQLADSAWLGMESSTQLSSQCFFSPFNLFQMLFDSLL